MVSIQNKKEHTLLNCQLALDTIHYIHEVTVYIAILLFSKGNNQIVRIPIHTQKNLIVSQYSKCIFKVFWKKTVSMTWHGTSRDKKSLNHEYLILMLFFCSTVYASKIERRPSSIPHASKNFHGIPTCKTVCRKI